MRTQYLAQTLDQMHDAIPLSLSAPPAIENIAAPGCGDTDCEWNSFEDLVKKAIDPKFVLPGGNYQM